MKIRGIIVVLILALSSTTMSYALSWHEALIKELTGNPNVKTNMVVERNLNTKRISKAEYRFIFKGEDLAQMLRVSMLKVSNDAIKFSIDDNMILMQLYEPPGLYYNYKLSSNKENGYYQFLVSIGSKDNLSSMMDIDRDMVLMTLYSSNDLSKELIQLPICENSSYTIITDSDSDILLPMDNRDNKPGQRDK